MSMTVRVGDGIPVYILLEPVYTGMYQFLRFCRIACKIRKGLMPEWVNNRPF
jgi:hypothetical protein